MLDDDHSGNTTTMPSLRQRLVIMVVRLMADYLQPALVNLQALCTAIGCWMFQRLPVICHTTSVADHSHPNARAAVALTIICSIQLAV